MSSSEISNFYKGKKIFCTGATGFMGKFLVEKLLRDCPDLSTLYILIRDKKGSSAHQRYVKYINEIVFDDIRNKNPEQFDKIKVICGDVTLENLGLSSTDTNELIENVNLIFHCAANVRFDLTLKEAVNFNLNGTYRVLCLAERMKNLQVFVHVSTAYCHCEEINLEEKFYPTIENPVGIMNMIETLSNETLEEITPKLIRNLPNTYALTKGFSESLIHSYRKKFPIAIARPPIVTASWKQSVPGYIEGMHGPTGIFVAAAKGVLRTMHCNPDYPAEFIPVDICINTVIALAKKRSLVNNDDVLYCNITDNGTNPLKWGEMLELGRKIVKDYPMNFVLWYPDGRLCTNYFMFMLNVILFHYIPAIIIDGILIVTGNKPILLNVQKRISQGLKVLQYYTTRQWIFRNDNFNELRKSMNNTDKEIFYCDISKLNYNHYMRDYMLGIKRFIVKESLEDLPKARLFSRRMYILDRLVTVVFYAVIIYMTYNYFYKKFWVSTNLN